jgi:hypothetical protein
MLGCAARHTNAQSRSHDRARAARSLRSRSDRARVESSWLPCQNPGPRLNPPVHGSRGTPSLLSQFALTGLWVRVSEAFVSRVAAVTRPISSNRCLPRGVTPMAMLEAQIGPIDGSSPRCGSGNCSGIYVDAQRIIRTTSGFFGVVAQTSVRQRFDRAGDKRGGGVVPAARRWTLARAGPTRRKAGRTSIVHPGVSAPHATHRSDSRAGSKCRTIS